MVEELLTAAIATGVGVAVYVGAAARVVKQYERGLVFRFGRLREEVRGPGFTTIVPFVERLRKVNMQIVTLPVPAQEGITRDNVTVRVDAVVYFKVVDPASAIVAVEDYRFAVSQMAQTSLRSIIGKSDLDDLLSNREMLNQGLELMIDSPAVGWGVQIDRVEIKDVSLPETMKRSMARQAEADRERRARVINADAELQACTSSPRRRRSCRSSPRRCSCACCTRSWRSPPRRTPRWYCRSRWSCCASWSARPLRPRRPPRGTDRPRPARLPKAPGRPRSPTRTPTPSTEPRFRTRSADRRTG